MSAEKFLTVEQAASRLGTDTNGLLLLAAAGEIPIAVDADSWVAVDASEMESGHIHRKPGTQRILNAVWLYMRAGYMRRFLSLRPDEAIQAGGKFRSRPDGPCSGTSRRLPRAISQTSPIQMAHTRLRTSFLIMLVSCPADS